jgi:hypothetical protein
MTKIVEFMELMEWYWNSSYIPVAVASSNIRHLPSPEMGNGKPYAIFIFK